jgi:hypothetical protein
VGKFLPAVTGAGIVLAGDPVIVTVEPVRVIPGTAVLEEEDLRSSLAGKVRAVLVGRRSGAGLEEGYRQEAGGEAGKKRCAQG